MVGSDEFQVLGAAETVRILSGGFCSSDSGCVRWLAQPARFRTILFKSRRNIWLDGSKMVPVGADILTQRRTREDAR